MEMGGGRRIKGRGKKDGGEGQGKRKRGRGRWRGGSIGEGEEWREEQIERKGGHYEEKKGVVYCVQSKVQPDRGNREEGGVERVKGKGKEWRRLSMLTSSSRGLGVLRRPPAVECGPVAPSSVHGGTSVTHPLLRPEIMAPHGEAGHCRPSNKQIQTVTQQCSSRKQLHRAVLFKQI